MPLPERQPPAASRAAALLVGSVRLAVLLGLGGGLTLVAGDLLRQGAKPNVRNPSATSEGATAAAAAQARSRATDALARTTQAMNAVKAAQAAARAAATASGAANLGADPAHPGLVLPNVPDGLAVGGLQVEPGTAWSGASLPIQSGGGGASVNVNIVQTSAQALLNWRTFNVGRNTRLNFDQSAGGAEVGTWIAFNKVNDPSGSPSQILGSITAPGQVYIINQNGIIFGGTSQVNTHILVASSLPINGSYDASGRLIADLSKNTLITRGLLNNPDAQFLFSALPQPAGNKGPTEIFTPPALPANGKIGDVTVQAGAQLIAPTTASNVGGRIMLLGANVTNAGSISTPDGQTIIAAGLQVGVESHKSSDATLRGLDVYVGSVKDAASKIPEYAGVATNTGIIDIARASVIMAGKKVNQSGIIDSSTSVALNGRVDLVASYDAIQNTRYDAIVLPDVAPFFYRATGTVTLGTGSITRILPEYTNASKVVGTKLALRSQVNIQGRVVHLKTGATLLAPNAEVAISAGVWDFVLNASVGSNTFVYTSGQFYMERNSQINVAGSTGVSAPIAQNILTLELRGAELANTPLQRNGMLRAKSITVDIRDTGIYNGMTWVGTPLGDVSGYVGLIERAVDQLTVEGGTVAIRAGGSVVMQEDAKVDVSGGYVNYEAGLVKTTRVLLGGRLFEIADASPDLVYDGIYTGKFQEVHSRWGITKTFQVPWMTGEHYEQAYIQGFNGGALDITAPAMALDGTLLGNTVSGPRQRETMPAPSALSLTFNAQKSEPPTYPVTYPSPLRVVFTPENKQAPAEAFALDVLGDPLPLRPDRAQLVLLSPELFNKSGFGSLVVNNLDGSIEVPEDVTVSAPASGFIALAGANVTISGRVEAPGGSVSISVYNISPSVVETLRNSTGAELPPVNLDRGNFTLTTGASISTAGLIVDDRLSAPEPLEQPVALNGGSISIAAFNADLQLGSALDVSGGVRMSATGSRSYGTGGSLSIKTGQDLNLLGVLGGKLNLGSSLKGYSGGNGGSLTLQAHLVQIGGNAPLPGGLLLRPDFFRQGGFTNYTIIGLGNAGTEPDSYLPGLVVAPGTVVEPVAENLLAIPHVMGSDTLMLTTFMKPDGQRSPASLSLQSPGVTDEFDPSRLPVRGSVVMSEGSRIQTDPLGSVSFSGSTVSVLGTVIAPGGKITITGANSYPSTETAPSAALPTVFIGSTSKLSTAGTSVFTPDRFGRNTGTVIPGGTISVSGNIVASAGAVLDVSGASNVFDVHPAYLNLDAYLNGELKQAVVPFTSGLTTPLWQSLGVPTKLDSNAGTISLKGGQMLFVDALLLGRAGGSTALGGTLNISSGRFYSVGSTSSTADINLVITQSKVSIPVPEQPGIGEPVRDASGQPLLGMGNFAADQFQRGGFDSLTLGGNVRFSGPVALRARSKLAVASGGIIEADSDVLLEASYALLGQPFLAPVQPSQQLPIFTQSGPSGTQPIGILPTFGTGSLSVVAKFIDIGNLSLEGIGRASLKARGGEIRGNGTLQISGQLTLEAGQIYPTTAGIFNIIAYDYPSGGTTQPGTVTIAGGGSRELPYSAGGTLNIYGSNIQQGGILRAPYGAVHLGWDGTGAAPQNPMARASVQSTRTLSLLSGSITSVSGLNSKGEALILPFGMSPDGISWIDPYGVDITASGIPAKEVTLGAANLVTEQGSVIDFRGGGDLLADRFVFGNGGSVNLLGSTNAVWNTTATYESGELVTYNGVNYSARVRNNGQLPGINSFWSLVPQSFAVIPGYRANYSPYAPFNTSSDTSLNLTYPDAGYVDSSLSVGDQIYLSLGGGLSAGVYTLLPARYALLPGSFLVKPVSGMPVGTFDNADGSAYVSGYRFNQLNETRKLSPLYSRFEVSGSETFRERAKYETFFANDFLKEGAEAVDAKVPRLPRDGGYLLFQSTLGMRLDGDVYARGASGGRGGVVDINTPLDIVINQNGKGGGAGVVALSANKLSAWGAESMLIGGIRTFGDSSTAVTVRAGNITLDNVGTPLSGAEIILAANCGITLAPGSAIEQSGSLVSADSLVVTGSLQLSTVGQSLTFTRGGSPINFPSGTLGNNRITSTVGGVITAASGSNTNLIAGVSTTLSTGSTVTLNGGGTLSFTSGTGGAIPISIGDGVLIRVSGDPSAQTSRTAVTSSTLPNLVVGDGAILKGASLTLDSTYAFKLSPAVTLNAQSINLNSGQISMQFNNPGPLLPTMGIVLTGKALQDLQAAQALSLLSYSSIDLYGNGSFNAQGAFALHASSLRGFNQAGGLLSFKAANITIDNSANVPTLAAAAPANGTLQFNSETFTVGSNQVRIDQFNVVEINATAGVLASGAGGLTVQNALTVSTPVIAASRSATQTLIAEGGAVNLLGGGGSGTLQGGLGASLLIRGASVNASTNIRLPSGLLSIQATTGSLTVGRTLDVGGTAQFFYDLVKYTDAGEINLTANAGPVSILAGSVLNASANSGGGNAGRVTINSPTSLLSMAGQLLGVAGAGGISGILSLDVGSLQGGLISSISPAITGFNQSRAIRDRLDALVTVDGSVIAHNFTLSADAGSILVNSTGNINASGITGGTIDLKASGSVRLASGALLNASAQDFSNAGKGGEIHLEAGSKIGALAPSSTAVVDIQAGSNILLTVAANNASSSTFGEFTGTLHLRAPQNAAHVNKLQVNTINGTITGASSILIEGYKTYDLTGLGAGAAANQGIIQAGGTIVPGAVLLTSTVQTDATSFAANFGTMINTLVPDAALHSTVVLAPGVEIINRTGRLTLGSSSSLAANDWNLATFRFGPKSAPGVLTMKAAGDVLFFNTLSDGFTPTLASTDQSWMWLARVTNQNTSLPTLPTNTQSWTYRLTAGADFSGADFRNVTPLTSLTANTGSLLLGKNGGQNLASTSGSGALTSTAINPAGGPSLFQVIRTGTGDITITAGRDVQLLNQFATIYTAGVAVASPTTVFSANDFVVPILNRPVATQNPTQGALGAQQQVYTAQYTLAGGNVSLNAQEDLERWTTIGGLGQIADSSRQMPNNWLHRRSYVDPVTGLFGQMTSFTVNPAVAINDISASTTWWVDFSNFFEGVGALGGGNVTLTAGRDINNIDGVVPTNARMPGRDSGINVAPDANRLLETGGGDLMVRAGRDINGGVYYVERGKSNLVAGNSIRTNNTRSPSLTTLNFSVTSPPFYDAPQTWLATTLFLGKASSSITARGDLLLGPIANPFLLPAGLQNKFWYKTYFNTYSPTSAVDIASIGGTVTLRESVTLGDTTSAIPALQAWYQKELLLTSSPSTAAYYQPWLRLAESRIEPFVTTLSLLPPTVRATSFSADINIVGGLTLFPSPAGTLEMVAAGAVNGLRPSGVSTQLLVGSRTTAWTSSRINVSDANPASVPSITAPFTYYAFLATNSANRNLAGNQNVTQTNFLSKIDKLFQETGSTSGANSVIQKKQELHASGPLHASDPNPLRLYALDGDISGITLFSPKSTRVLAGKDITDIAFYLQNVDEEDLSLISAGRDIVAYNPSSTSRVASSASGNAVNSGQTPLLGDIQIGGPGVLEILAGRDFKLGAAPTASDGTGTGVSSIGNSRNPFLPFAGADIIIAAGLGGGGSLGNSLDFDGFIEQILRGANGARYFSELSAIKDFSEITGPEALEELAEDQRNKVALELFYLALRDAGRDHATTGSYQPGFDAISALFTESGEGDITLSSREIKTKSGGSINLLAPSGGLALGNVLGNNTVPPGIVTESGGNINIFANDSVDVGVLRIFTLRGGNILIWSSTGDIGAGSAPKTVVSAPPTRVLVDAQSADVVTDLAGLSTGGGIGVLATVSNVAAGDVDLIAPTGTVDAGDAGIRATGNLTIAANAVLNASNISVSGTSSGTPAAPTVAAPNIGGLTSASNTAGAGNQAAQQATSGAQRPADQVTELPSIVTVEVLGYGGGESNAEEEEEERRRKRLQNAEETSATPPAPQ